MQMTDLERLKREKEAKERWLGENRPVWQRDVAKNGSKSSKDEEKSQFTIKYNSLNSDESLGI